MAGARFVPTPEGAHELRPAPKKLGLLFVPTAILGALGVLGSTLGFVQLLAGRQHSALVLIAVLVFSSVMLLAGLYVLTFRVRFVLDGKRRVLRTERRSVFGRRVRELDLALASDVHLAWVRPRRHADQPNIPNYVAVQLRDASGAPLQRLQSTIDPSEARALAHQLAALAGLRVHDAVE